MADVSYTCVGVHVLSWDRLKPVSRDARYLWLALYTSSEMKGLVTGMWKGSIQAMARLMGGSYNDAWNALDELLKADLVAYDGVQELLCMTELPDACERAHNHRAIAGWWRRFNLAHPCPVRDAHVKVLRWLLDQGTVTPQMEQTWAETFGRIAIPVPTGPSTPPSSSDTSTIQQPSLFGDRAGAEIKRNQPVNPKPDPSTLGSPLGSVPEPDPEQGSGSVPVQDQVLGSVPDVPAAVTSTGNVLRLVPERSRRLCTCTGTCKGTAGLGPEWECALADTGSTVAFRPHTPAHPPPPPLTRDEQRQQIIAAVSQRHVADFNAVRAEINSPVRNMSPVDGFVHLRELLDSMPSLDTALADCLYALDIRRHEAVVTNSMARFSSAMWQRRFFDIALAMTTADIDQAAAKASRGRTAGPTQRALDELAELEAAQERG